MILKLEINKILKIIFSPFVGWRSANFEILRSKNITLDFLIVAVVIFIVRLIGTSLKYLPDTDFLYILIYSSIRFVLDLVFYITIINVVNALLPYYNLKKDKLKISVLCLVSLLPFYASVVIFNLFPSLYFFSVLSLYSFVLYYLGIKYYLKIDKDRVMVFFVLSSLIIVGLYCLLIFVLIKPFFNFVY